MNELDLAKMREQMLEELHDLEHEHLEVTHVWNKAVINYRRKRRKILDQLSEINQMKWDFDSMREDS